MEPLQRDRPDDTGPPGQTGNHNSGLLVDRHGTRRISDREAQLVLDAPVGVDIYPA